MSSSPPEFGRSRGSPVQCGWTKGHLIRGDTLSQYDNASPTKKIRHRAKNYRGHLEMDRSGLVCQNGKEVTPDEQAGFRPGPSATDQVVFVRTVIEV
ncbi:hypothetical protein RB195_021836 [Necator americanus]|uniref:FHA domain-containing protein n=1 Tax=Necator americanus TaxID=51031 RepID=A0ABR1EDH3_NECAM